MTSFRQIEANRRNAIRSTGPNTEEGKRRSRRNAIRLGLCAKTVIDDGERQVLVRSTGSADPSSTKKPRTMPGLCNSWKFRSVARDADAAPIEAVVQTDANNIIGKLHAPRDDRGRNRASRDGGEDVIDAVEIEVKIFELPGPSGAPKSSFNTTTGCPAGSIL
jgi:hypothetical protein